MKTLDENDPRLTAYALDELDAGEREAVETYLAGNAAARTAVEEIRETVATLRDEFRGEPALALGAKQREAVLGNGTPLDDAESKIVRPGGFSRVSRFLGIAAVAACLGLVSVVGLRHFMEEVSRPALKEAAAESEKATARKEQASEEDRSGSVNTETRFMKRDESAVPAPVDALASDPQAAAEEAGASGPSAVADNVAAGKASAAMRQVAPKPVPSDYAASPKKKDAPVSRETIPEMPSLDAAPFAEAISAPAPAGSSTGFGDGFGGGGAGDGLGGGSLLGGASANDPSVAGMRESKQLRGASKVEWSGAVAPNSTAEPADKPMPKMAELQKSESDAAAPELRRRTALPAAEERAGAAGERYAELIDNPFVSTWDENVSTFSIDVDNAAYSNIRRFVTRNHQLPPKDAVRIEEMINYFDYDYPQPADKHPFSVNLEVASCPWEKEARLVRIGLKGLEMHPDQRPASNLVFLIDVSGSMSSDDKLPLLQSAMMALVDGLNEDDSIAIVVYAGSSGLVLDSTSGDLKGKIKEALGKLQSGGSTNGGQGIELAYATAKRHFIEGGVNRVVLASDGDFNVGVTNRDDLIAMVEERAKSDAIFLTVLGFGQGNLNDNMMEQIADKGNGNYFYIDNGKEGQRVLVDRLSATLVTIAKDVKIQVDFNPAKVARYRLIGYANRMLANKDFRDDTKDAGEIGAGHTVTALYQVLPAGTEKAVAEAEEKARVESEESKYLRPRAALGDAEAARAQELVSSEELLTVRLRYKQPDGEKAEEFEVGITDPGTRWEEASGDFRFAASVAGYGMLLRDSEYKGLLNYDLVLELADEGKGSDPHGLRAEFIDLVESSKAMSGDGE